MTIELEIADIDIGSHGEVVTSRDDIALIDADTLVFASCLHCEEKVNLLGRDFYTDIEWEELLVDPTYDKEEHAVYVINMEYAFNYSQEKLNTILENTGCKDFELHFTSGRESFRYTKVDKEYKANRTQDSSKRAPTGLTKLKEMWVEKHPDKAFIWREWEADDIVVCKKLKDPGKYLLVALDKDVLYSIEGTHFNYYSSSHYNIDMKFYDVDAETAMKHPYIQTLTGDPGDGVYGLKGVGAKTAEKILASCTTPQQCWETVIREYESRGMLKNGKLANVVDAITNMRLVNMNQLIWENEEWQVKLWKPAK